MPGPYLRVPSLAERREDIALLANHFCAAACARHGRFQKQLLEAALEESDWNVAETAAASISRAPTSTTR